MAGTISDEDLALVRDRARLDEVVSQYVQLRPAGGGSWKGLCPFHDEKTPSFNVTPSRGLFYCFGCGEGGDVFTFLQKIENLSFVESVQRLADKYGVPLRIQEFGTPGQKGLRVKILEANQAASEFYQDRLLSDEGFFARQMLDQRGFDATIAKYFSVGYAPKSGRELHNHLNQLGFEDSILVKAGLIRQNGGWDFFQGRVMWPIKDSASAVLGFGARRLYEDDRMPAKYVNTPETPVYKKSSVLYGLDLARKNIGKKSQAVVMEGYTDVMAAHLAGIDTAVASCGTAFAEEHARLLQRMIGVGEGRQSEIIFTFDGDEAGQKAALKVFDFDQDFITQTYVAVAPDGLDPCDLRIQKGEAAVRELVSSRIPLYTFVIGNILKSYDLDRVDGRLTAVRAAAPLVKSVRDPAMVSGYVRDLARMVGMDIEQVRQEVSIAIKAGRGVNHRPNPRPKTEPEEDSYSGISLPDKDDRSLAVERGTLKLMLQLPTLFDVEWNGVQPEDFTNRAYRAVFEAIRSVPYDGKDDWLARVRQQTPDKNVVQLEIELIVEDVLRDDPDEIYASEYTNQLQLRTVSTKIDELKSKMQRTNPQTDSEKYQEMFTQLIEWERYRKELHESIAQT